MQVNERVSVLLFRHYLDNPPPPNQEWTPKRLAFGIVPVLLTLPFFLIVVRLLSSDHHYRYCCGRFS